MSMLAIIYLVLCPYKKKNIKVKDFAIEFKVRHVPITTSSYYRIIVFAHVLLHNVMCTGIVPKIYKCMCCSNAE